MCRDRQLKDHHEYTATMTVTIATAPTGLTPIYGCIRDGGKGIIGFKTTDGREVRPVISFEVIEPNGITHDESELKNPYICVAEMYNREITPVDDSPSFAPTPVPPQVVVAEAVPWNLNRLLRKNDDLSGMVLTHANNVVYCDIVRDSVHNTWSCMWDNKQFAKGIKTRTRAIKYFNAVLARLMRGEIVELMRENV